MKSYIEIDENSNGAILRKAREDYSKRNNINFGQKELAEYLGIAPSSVGGWEQGRREIPEKHLTRINNLLGTNFATYNETYGNKVNSFQAIVYFYFGVYKFTKRQCEFIIAKLLLHYSEDVLAENKNELKKYNKIVNSIKKNNIFTKISYQHYKECISYIQHYIQYSYKRMRTQSNKIVYICRFSSQKLTEIGFKRELYRLLTSLDFSRFIYEPYENIPVYNSSGIIEFYEKLLPKFNDKTYEYVYTKIDDIEKKYPEKYPQGALALIRLGEFCFPNEDIIIKCRNQFTIEHIKNRNDLITSIKNAFREDDLIEYGYEIIGAVVMIDYSTSSIKDNDSKIEL